VVFIPINIDKSTLKHFPGDELSNVVELSKKLHISDTEKFFSINSKTEFFEINSNRIASYKIINEDDQVIRILVFKYYDNYYDCAAFFRNDYKYTEDEQLTLFSIQQSIFSSLK
jgi:hypothetical protein